MKVPFQNDGPIHVPDSAYQDFVAFLETGPKFDDLYHRWICERYSEDFRRLCIRMLLRQIDYFTTEKRPYYAESTLSRIFHINNGNKRSELYWTLYNRPSLIDMLTTELLYNIDHNLYNSVERNYYNGVYELILFLLPLVSEQHCAEDLWHCHPLSQTPTSLEHPAHNAQSYWRQTLKAWTYENTLPDWIRDKLWGAISATIKQEAAKFQLFSIFHSKSSYYYLNSQDPHDIDIYPYTVSLCNFLKEACNSKASPSAVASLFALLEDSLPSHVAYLPAQTRLGCLQYANGFLHDTDLTLRIMYRHLPKFDFATAHKNGFRFSYSEAAAIYGLLGFTHSAATVDTDFLACLRNLAQLANDPANQRSDRRSKPAN